jgi:hypothetical protein
MNYLDKMFSVLLTLLTTGGMPVAGTDSIVPFRVEECSDASRTDLHLSGLVNHSALGIYKIVTEQENSTLQVLVHLALKHDGNLDYTLSIPDDVDIVTFGKEGTAIWIRRDASHSSDHPAAGVCVPYTLPNDEFEYYSDFSINIYRNPPFGVARKNRITKEKAEKRGNYVLVKRDEKNRITTLINVILGGKCHFHHEYTYGTDGSLASDKSIDGCNDKPILEYLEKIAAVPSKTEGEAHEH